MSEITEDVKAILAFINCDYELYDGENDQEEILGRYHELAKQGRSESFYPLIILPSLQLVEIMEYLDEFIAGIDPGGLADDTAAHRRLMIEKADETTGTEQLSVLLDHVVKWVGVENEELMGQFEPTEPIDTLTTEVFTYGTNNVVIIAKIPAAAPWELAAWVPMGGFNDCPDPVQQVAIFRHWHEKYGAVPAMVSCDSWQLTLTNPPVIDDEAELLAQEHFAFCPDSVLQGTETIRRLASLLKDATAWFFWWD